MTPTRWLLRALPRAAAFLLVVPSAVACGDRSDARTPEPIDTASWSLTANPKWRIGSVSGPTPYVFDRVFSGLLADGGAALVGNSGTQQIRVFDGDGRNVTAAGRQGGGPGEFRSINWMSRFRGDSILVFDLRSQRFSVLTPRGAFVRSFQNSASGGPAYPFGVFPDGSILVGVEKSYDPRIQTGRVRDTLALYRLAPDGAGAAAIRRLSGAEWLLYGDGMRYRAIRLPFGGKELVAVAGGRIIHGSSDSPRLNVMDISGRDVAAIELPLSSRRLGAEEVAEGLDEAIDDRREREVVRRELRRSSHLTAPAMTALRVDPSGNLWVRTFPPAGSTSVRWLVVSPDGNVLGSLLMPANWSLLDVRGGTLLVRERDADGIERISLREVEK